MSCGQVFNLELRDRHLTQLRREDKQITWLLQGKMGSEIVPQALIRLGFLPNSMTLLNFARRHQNPESTGLLLLDNEEIYAAAFNTTLGFSAAMRNNTRAAPLGERVPCSQ